MKFLNLYQFAAKNLRVLAASVMGLALVSCGGGGGGKKGGGGDFIAPASLDNVNINFFNSFTCKFLRLGGTAGNENGTVEYIQNNSTFFLNSNPGAISVGNTINVPPRLVNAGYTFVRETENSALVTINFAGTGTTYPDTRLNGPGAPKTTFDMFWGGRTPGNQPGTGIGAGGTVGTVTVVANPLIGPAIGSNTGNSDVSNNGFPNFGIPPVQLVMRMVFADSGGVIGTRGSTFVTFNSAYATTSTWTAASAALPAPPATPTLNQLQNFVGTAFERSSTSSFSFNSSDILINDNRTNSPLLVGYDPYPSFDPKDVSDAVPRTLFQSPRLTFRFRDTVTGSSTVDFTSVSGIGGAFGPPIPGVEILESGVTNHIVSTPVPGGPTTQAAGTVGTYSYATTVGAGAIIAIRYPSVNLGQVTTTYNLTFTALGAGTYTSSDGRSGTFDDILGTPIVTP